MNTIASHAPASAETSSKAHWAGHVMSGLAIAFLLFDAAIKLVPLSVVTETMAALGYPPGLERGLGVLTLVCVLLYAVPRTAVLGAILLTGLFGGAMATRVSAARCSRTCCSDSISDCWYGAACICAIPVCVRSFRSASRRGQT